ncbi:hypothetical protein QFZ31_005769 [Neobacillus niacini]|uniref:hypothetical protein n=1 Tax=Neobacillus driksii TaxID=3035913 RepID=UPI00278B7F47|nr:hypothetical protein [Neobacillus niacini]MDQ0975891.1 hypothetical protein [Neobacillus niacini]
MKEIIELIKDFEGIIGALLGVIVTLILTQMLKSVGKIKFYIKENEIDFINAEQNMIGEYIESKVEDRNEATNINLKHTIEIYNGSEIPKIIRDVKYSFYYGNNLLLAIDPDDKSTERYTSYSHYRDSFLNINLPPKQITNIEIIQNIKTEETEIVKNCTKIYLEMNNHRGKKIKVLLKKFD